MSVNDQKAYPWAKSWMEEIFPASRLAAEIGLSDDTLFKWTPVGVADVEFDRGTEHLRIQCTTAYAERDGTVAAQGGHLRKLEMKEANKTGMVWLGGGLNHEESTSMKYGRHGESASAPPSTKSSSQNILGAHADLCPPVQLRSR